MLSYSILLLTMTDVTPRSGTTPQLSMFQQLIRSGVRASHLSVPLLGLSVSYLNIYY